jgi:hypothetical protein
MKSMTPKKALPSKYKITLYWRDKVIIDGKVLTYKERQQPPYKERGADWFLIDWFEPSCWACHTSYVSVYEQDIPEITDKTEQKIGTKIWNDNPLQRCHIIPASLGGSSDPSNLFLMCPTCHDLAPDTNSTETFFQWVARRPEEARAIFNADIQLFIAECKKYGDYSNDELKIIHSLAFAGHLFPIDKFFFASESNFEPFSDIWNERYKEVEVGQHKYQMQPGAGVKLSSLVGSIIPLYTELRTLVLQEG